MLILLGLFSIFLIEIWFCFHSAKIWSSARSIKHQTTQFLIINCVVFDVLIYQKGVEYHLAIMLFRTFLFTFLIVFFK